MKTKKVKLNIVLVVKASKYFADQLKDNVERTVGANCFNTNNRTVLSAKVVSIKWNKTWQEGLNHI